MPAKKTTGFGKDGKATGLHSHPGYDAIVVGARVAGASTAMLLARQGFRVLLVDRRRPGTDTLSTHALMRGGVLQLKRWGLLDALIEAGTPPVRRTVMHYGDIVEAIPIKLKGGVDALFAPRRTVLDSILVDAAIESGVDVRFGVSVTGLLKDETGRITGVAGRNGAGSFEARATMVVGADGVSSLVARQTGARVYKTGESSSAIVYGYWPNVGAKDTYEFFYRPGASAGFIPTNDGLVNVWVGTPTTRFLADGRSGLETEFYRILEQAAPEAAKRVRSARRSTPLRSFPGTPGFLRQPWGPGWALVGDAGHFKDPLSTHGMTAAMRDSELLARAIGSTLRGELPEREALESYRLTRDHYSTGLLEISDRVASYQWDLHELRPLLMFMSKSMNGDLEALEDFERTQSASAA